MDRDVNFFKKNPIVVCVLHLFLTLALPIAVKWRKLSNSTYDYSSKTVIYQAVYMILSVLSLYLISGKKMWMHKNSNVKWAIKQLNIYFIINIVLSLLGIFGFFVLRKISNKWSSGVIFYLLPVYAGVFEEITFRAIINDSMIYQFRNNKKIHIWIAIFSSILFGVMHVIGSNFAGPLEILQAAEKVLNAGLFGLALLFVYWKTHDIWTCVILHTLYDFILSLPIILFGIPEKLKEIGYVNSGSLGVVALLAYLPHIGIGIYVVRKMYYGFVKDIDFNKLRKEW